MSNDFVIKLSEKIKRGEVISPSLFLGNNIELLNNNIQDIAKNLVKQFNIPEQYIFTLEYTSEKIKIGEIKKFLEISHSHPGYKFQIFIIEDISRFTIPAANSCLKFFEEPGVQNIIFLSNISESGVLDTILSRVKISHIGTSQIQQKNEFYYNLIEEYNMKKNHEIFTYFFRNKLEKDEYISFLKNLLLYATDTHQWIPILSELHDDIYAISNNNINAKFVVDKYLLKI